MYLFSRIATSSSVVLGLTGLAVFLSPLGWGDNSQLLSSIYKEFVSGLESLSLDLLTNEDQTRTPKELKPLFDKFKTAFEHSESQGKTEKEKIEKSLESSKKLEEELTQLYKQNKDNLEKLGKVSDELKNGNEQKLEAEAELEGIKQSIQLLGQFNEAFEKLNSPLNELIVALNGQSEGGSGGAPTLKENRPKEH